MSDERSSGSIPAINQIREGDRRAFESLFREFYEPLCHFTLNYVDQLQVAEDLVQDVFLDLWRDRQQLDLNESLRAYLYGMTRNRALKHLRRQRMKGSFAETGDLEKSAPNFVPDVASDALLNKEQKDEALRAVEALPEQRRKIFLLSRRHDLTYAEIAEALQISIKTVETQMTRALTSLRERLQSHVDASL